MNNQQKITEENLKKNRPTKVLPIMNTVFAVFLIAAAVWLKIRNDYFTTPFFIIFIVLCLLFPVASWYNSYFSKVKNIKKIYNYEHETKEIVSYIKRFKEYQTVTINRENQLKIKYELTENIVDKNPTYIKEHCSFGLPKEDTIIITLGVGFAGLELKGYSKEFIGLVGVLPRSVWYKKRLKAPNAKKGKITIEASGFNLKGKQIIQALKSQDTYYDNKTGWILIGEKKTTILDEVIEIMNDVYVVIRGDELVSVWLKIDSGLAI